MESNKYGVPLYWIVVAAGVFQVLYTAVVGAWYLYTSMGIVPALGLILAVFILYTVIASTI